MNENITPLPWRVTGSDGSQISGGNTCIASVWLPRKPNEERMEGESWLAMRERTQPDRDAIDRELRANAAYIVEASNAYPALTARVKELEEIRDYYMQSAEKASKGRHWAEIRVKELEEALTRIANRPSEMDWGHPDEVQDAMHAMEQIADAALNKEPTT